MSQEDDDRAMILNAIITNTRTKIIFGGLSPEDADFMARVLFTGFLDLQEYKDQSLRPTAIGNKKEIVRSHSIAEHEAEHHTHAKTSSHTHGVASGTMASTSTSVGDFSASGDNAGLVMQAPAQLLGPNQPGAQMLPVPLTQSTGQSNSRGSSEMSGTSSGSSHVEVDMHSKSQTVGHGKSRGTSKTEGESETFVTDYALLPTTMYSLTEQQNRVVGELMNLGLRECFVKVGNQRPVRTRTVDLEPAFRSDYFRRVWMPIYRAKSLAHSPFLLPSAQVDQQLAARVAPVAVPHNEEPDFTKPEPLSMLIDNPAAFAQNFHAKNLKPKPLNPPKLRRKPHTPRPGRKPVGGLPPAADRFTIIDGDKDSGVDK